KNIGRPGCSIPTCGLNWITWHQPVVLDQWPTQPIGTGERFTSIGSWRGPSGPVEYKRTTFGLRVHEFRRFAAMPRLTAGTFEVALDIHAAETRDVELLSSNGWELADPARVAHDPWVYREYIQHSKA